MNRRPAQEPPATPASPPGSQSPSTGTQSPDQGTTPAQDATLLERALFEVKRVIVGQDRMIERMFVALLARGHCLLEGVPGVAKTLAVETLATRRRRHASPASSSPPTWCPPTSSAPGSTGQSSEKFDVELGPVFVNFLLADEINRAPAKVQSALLEVMAEQQVSIGGETHEVPDPFLVMATQNPIEQEGVYPLPEAQRDRFLMKIVVGYPTDVEEREIVYRMGVRTAGARRRCSTPAELIAPAGPGRRRCSCTTRWSTTRSGWCWPPATPAEHGMPDVAQLIQYGASPRASLGIVRATRALALLRGRDYALPQDVQDIAPDILRHRLVLSYDALADDIPADQIVDRVHRRPCRCRRWRRGRAPPAGRPTPASGATGPPARAAWPGRCRARCRPGRARPEADQHGLPLRRRARRRGARPAAAARHPQARRAAAGRLPRPAARAGQRGRRVARVPAGRRRAPDGLAGHRPHHRAARAATIADRELETWLAVDLSASLDFGTAQLLKRDLAIAAAAAVAHLTVRGGNRIGAVVGTGGGHADVRLPARPGRKEAQGLLRAIARTARRCPGRADLGALIDMLNRPPRRRGLAVVISDFLAPPAEWARPLRKLGVRHDVLAIEVVDPRELELPDVGVLALADPETGALHEVQTADPKLRAPVRAGGGRPARARSPRRSAAAGAAHLRLRTDSDWLLDIVRFVAAAATRTHAGDHPMIRFLQPWWLLARAAGARCWPACTCGGSCAAARSRCGSPTSTCCAPSRPRGIGLARGTPPAVAFLLSLLVAGARAWPGRRSTREEPLERATVMLAHRRVAVDAGRRRRADPDRGGPGRPRRTSCAELPPSVQPRPGLVRQVGQRLVSPTKDRAAVIAGDRRAAAGRGDRDRRGGLHLPGRDPRRCPPTGPQGPPPARIVLLSDGYRTSGRSDRGGGRGGVDGQRAGLDDRVRHRRRAWSTSAGSCSGCRWTGWRWQQLAETTQGYFYEAATASELKQVYEDMGSSIGYRTEAKEIAQWFVGLGLLFALAAAGMSLLWTSRLP